MNYLIQNLDSAAIFDIMDIYENNLLINLDNDNINNIVNFLKENNITNIRDILINYLDLFILDLTEFKIRFVNLTNKFSTELPNLLNTNIDLLESMVE